MASIARLVDSSSSSLLSFPVLLKPSLFYASVSVKSPPSPWASIPAPVRTVTLESGRNNKTKFALLRKFYYDWEIITCDNNSFELPNLTHLRAKNSHKSAQPSASVCYTLYLIIAFEKNGDFVTYHYVALCRIDLNSETLCTYRLGTFSEARRAGRSYTTKKSWRITSFNGSAVLSCLVSGEEGLSGTGTWLAEWLNVSILGVERTRIEKPYTIVRREAEREGDGRATTVVVRRFD